MTRTLVTPAHKNRPLSTQLADYVSHFVLNTGALETLEGGCRGLFQNEETKRDLE
jgi:hypothetical protein